MATCSSAELLHTDPPQKLEGDHAMSNNLLIILAPAILWSLLAAGCGGGGSDDVAEQPQASPRVPAQASVQLEGCVVNSEWMGASDTAVHVRTADGRALDTVLTNGRGEFIMTVPARTAIVLTTIVAGPGDLALDTGSESRSLGACLLRDV
jgi:hypothetical protein